MRLSASDLDLLVYDFDGVMTDNRVAVNESAIESVQCNRADGLGVGMIRSLGLSQLILSTEANPVVAARARKLDLEVLQDIADKRAALADHCAARGFRLDRVLYVGNDVNDLAAMRAVGYPISPADGHPHVRAIARGVTTARGGDGVIREIADWLLAPEPQSGSAPAAAPDRLERLRAGINDGIRLRQRILDDEQLLARIDTMAQTVSAALARGGKLLLAGNGGSYADAQHIAAEFVGRFMIERAPLAAIALGMNGSSLTAIGNDYRYDDVFVRELRALGRTGDVLIVLSTSGHSKNLIEAIGAARELGITVFGLLGKGGGRIAELADAIVVPSDHTARIQEMHITIGHLLCGLVDDALPGATRPPR